MQILWGIAGLGLIVSVWSGPARAQEEASPVPKPTKQHELFQKDVGTWDLTVKSWMDPKGEPVESKATEVARMLPGGLWLLSEFTGEFGGRPFHGRGQFSYDIGKKKYVATWIDSGITLPILLEGTYDEATRTLTLTGDSADPLGRPLKMREQATYRADGTKLFTMFMKSDAIGPDFVKMMEITYRKRPGEKESKAK